MATGCLAMFPTLARVILIVEFFERSTYYAFVFSLDTFVRSQLGWTVVQSNIVVNVVYAVAPLASIFGAHFADCVIGRPKLLLRAGLSYAVGTLLIAICSIPPNFTDFPTGPRWYVTPLFAVGLLLFCLGFGSFKVAASPLLGESVDVGLAGHSSDERMKAQSRCYSIYFLVINVGSLVGILVAPLLSSLYGTSNVAFFVPFLVFSAWLFLDLLIIRSWMTAFPEPRLCQESSLRALAPCCFQGSKNDLVTGDPALESGDGLAVDPEEVPITELPASPTSQPPSIRAALLTFSVLPLYWLAASQSSTNLIVQAGCTDLPSWVQPAMLNNCGTVALIIALPLVELVWSKPKKTAVKMLVGLIISSLTMAYCAVVQHIIDTRGTTSDSGVYTPFEGQTPIPSAWLIVPFVSLSVASAFTDPTALECAFTLAPAGHRSLVMACYLLASSASGFLGLGMAPLAIPQNVVSMFAAMSVALGVASVAWIIAMRMFARATT